MCRIGISARLLGVRGIVIEDATVNGAGEEAEVAVAVRPNWRMRDRCGI